MKFVYTKELLKDINDRGILIKDHTLRRYIRELENGGYSNIERDETGARIFDEYDTAIINKLVDKIQLEKISVKNAITEVIDEQDEIYKTVDKKENDIVLSKNNSEIVELLRQLLEQNKELTAKVANLENKLDENNKRILELSYDNSTDKDDVNDDVHNTDIHEHTDDNTDVYIGIHSDDNKDSETAENSDIETNIEDVQERTQRDDNQHVHDAYNVQDKKKKPNFLARLFGRK